MRRWANPVRKRALFWSAEDGVGDEIFWRGSFVHVRQRAPAGGLRRFRAGDGKASGRDLKALFDEASIAESGWLDEVAGFKRTFFRLWLTLPGRLASGWM